MDKIKNTNKEFYRYWTMTQMKKELCRLNRVLNNCLKIITGLK